VDRTEIIAHVTKIVLGIHDAVRAGRQAKAQATDLESLKNDLIRVSSGTKASKEHRLTSADHEGKFNPSSIVTREGLDPGTLFNRERWLKVALFPGSFMLFCL